jgi:uncharacterized protein
MNHAENTRRDFLKQATLAGIAVGGIKVSTEASESPPPSPPIARGPDSGSARLERSLVDALAGLDVIDAHEHIGPELESRARTGVDVFTLFTHYFGQDLVLAGMSQADCNSLSDQRLPLEKRWATFVPYWRRARGTSYARSALIAARDLYGFDDINDQTYQALSRAMQEANKPDLYQKMWDRCRIRKVLYIVRPIDVTARGPLFVPVKEFYPLLNATLDAAQLTNPSFDPGAKVRTLDDFVASVCHYIARAKKQGAVGLKIISLPYKDFDRGQAQAVFDQICGGKPWSSAGNWYGQFAAPNPLKDYVLDQAIAYAAEQDLVIAVHSGYWSDFRTTDPLHMIPLIARHPGARFDVFHLGYPWVRETLMLAKGFPNVWLNLCWTHIISQRCAQDALDEGLDLLPANKIIAFGGDIATDGFENVYGHLVMAREDVARVLARRIAQKKLTESGALELARQWFWLNPLDLYRLKP